MVRCAVRVDCLDENTVVRFFQGELSPQELAVVDGHIDGCAVCRTLLSSLASSKVTAGAFSATEFASGSWDLRRPSSPPSSDQAALGPGVLLADRFLVQDLVGEGGMAQVFRGLDQQTGTKVAIKITQGRGTEELERFEREARLLLQLVHPAVVGYVANGRAADGTPYLVMQWLEGEDLAARLERGPLDADETVTLGLRVAGALAAAHELGIVHRDIKPSNIFLPDGRVERATVLDFGVARPSWYQASSVATRTGALLGTLGYMAPEQALGAKSVDGRADLFSLGCVLYECLVGVRLFGGAHAVEVLANLLTQPIERPGDRATDVPEALDGLIVRMLSREAAGRPPSSAAIATALERIESQLAGGKGRRWPGLVVAALLLIVPVVLLAAALRPGPPETKKTASGQPATTGDTPVVMATSTSTGAPTPPLVPSSASAPTAAPAPGVPVDAPSARARNPHPAAGSSSDPFGTYRN
jgi:hypothetical protein